jgi:hypothetical protein
MVCANDRHDSYQKTQRLAAWFGAASRLLVELVLHARNQIDHFRWEEHGDTPRTSTRPITRTSRIVSPRISGDFPRN